MEEQAAYTVTPEARHSILEQKLTLWKNTAFDAEIDVKVAKVLGNAEAERVATERLKGSLKAIAALEEIQAEQ